MRVLRNFMSISAGIFLLMAGQFAHAVTSSTTNASGVPGGQATTTLTLSFDSIFDFVGVEFWMEYHTEAVSLNTAASTVVLGGAEYSYADFLAALDAEVVSSSGDFYRDISDTPGFFSLSAGYFASGSAPLLGEITLKTVFDLQPGFSGSTDVVISRLTLSDANFDFVELATGEASLVSTISAVPEPEAWFMMLAGLGLLAVRRARMVRFAH